MNAPVLGALVGERLARAEELTRRSPRRCAAPKDIRIVPSRAYTSASEAN